MATPSYAPIVGGTETAVRELSRALRARGHSVDILSLNMEVKWLPRWKIVFADDNGGRLFRWGACNPLAWLRTPRLNRLLGRELDAHVVGRLQRLAMVHFVPRPGAVRLARSYDLVHCHDEVDLTFPVALRPHVMHLHTLADTYDTYQHSAFARRILRGSARSWVANSADTAQRGMALGLPGSRLTVVPNGVDPTVYTPGSTTPAAHELLFVGRLVPRKGIEVLLGALRHVALPVKLRVVGTPGSERYGQVLRAAAVALERISPHNVYFLGAQTGAQLVELYQNAAIFVCPSLIEPFGIVALEAMSCAKPVVASQVDGLAEVVDNGVTGLLVAPGDERSLAAQIERLIQDDGLRTRLGANGRHRVITHFTWMRVAECMERVYEQVTPTYMVARNQQTRAASSRPPCVEM